MCGVFGVSSIGGVWTQLYPTALSSLFYGLRIDRLQSFVCVCTYFCLFSSLNVQITLSLSCPFFPKIHFRDRTSFNLYWLLDLKKQSILNTFGQDIIVHPLIPQADFGDDPCWKFVSRKNWYTWYTMSDEQIYCCLGIFPKKKQLVCNVSSSTLLKMEWCRPKSFACWCQTSTRALWNISLAGLQVPKGIGMWLTKHWHCSLTDFSGYHWQKWGRRLCQNACYHRSTRKPRPVVQCVSGLSVNASDSVEQRCCWNVVLHFVGIFSIWSVLQYLCGLWESCTVIFA